MKRTTGWLRAASIITGLAFTTTASATTGYFQLGYGAKSLGLAGATVSNPQDSIAASTNPAGMALVGERVDAGITFFNPGDRSASLETSALGANFDVEAKSRRNLFFVPSLGYTSKINDKLYWGISMYGNGGMNTTYDRNIYDETAAVVGAFSQGIPSPPAPAPIPPGPGAAAFVPEGTSTQDFGLPVTDVGTLGVDLAQGVIAPTLSFKVHEKHTIGTSLLIGIQRFSAYGLGNFQCFTQTGQSDPAGTCAASGGAFSGTPSDGLTNNGHDWAYGAGVRVGWIGEVHPKLSLGAAVASKVYMTEFDDYDELFAEDGKFDIPANFTVGLTFKPTTALSLSFDFQRILYEGVNSLSNSGPGPGLTIPPGGGLLGTDDGLGFGWEDINVYRLAVDYRYNNEWNFRAGYSYNDQPIPDDQLLFNILAPATPKVHATVGFSYRPNSNSEWNFAYMHAFEEKVSSSQTAFGMPGEIKMFQNAVDISYSFLF
ncbi:MAG: outer membrane protein transport protein [Pseudomonadota bacterium]